MIKETCVTPGPRFQNLNYIHRAMKQPEVTQTADAFQVGLGQLQYARARQLDTSMLVYRASATTNSEVMIKVDDKGGWNLRNPQGRGDVAYQKGGSCGKWAVAIMTPLQGNERAVEGFVQNFARISQDRGMHIGQPPPPSEWLNLEKAGTCRTSSQMQKLLEEKTAGALATLYPATLGFVLE